MSSDQNLGSGSLYQVASHAPNSACHVESIFVVQISVVSESIHKEMLGVVLSLDSIMLWPGDV